MGNGNGEETKEATGTTTVAHSAAMVVSSREQVLSRIQPQNQSEMLKYCAWFAEGKVAGVKTPQEALGRIMAGMELGMTMLQALKGCFVTPDGKMGFEAKTLHAVCLTHPEVCEEFRCIETTDERATFRAKRRGQPARDYTFTIEDAKRAGLLSKDNWRSYTRDMLFARARGRAANGEFPDLTLGFPTTEELRDHVIDVQAEPVQPEIATPPRDVAKEILALKEEIAAAKTKELRAAVRAKLVAFERDVGGEAFQELRAFFNLCCAPKQPNPENGASASPGLAADESSP